MELKLHNLKAQKTKNRKRVGRGIATGQGTYAGRGLKGQKSRSGGKRGLKRKGLKMFLHQIPKKRGFKSFYDKMSVVNIDELAKKFDDKELITPKKIFEAGLIRSYQNGVKVLGSGKITKKLFVQAESFSKSAENAIKKAGGEIKIIK